MMDANGSRARTRLQRSNSIKRGFKSWTKKCLRFREYVVEQRAAPVWIRGRLVQTIELGLQRFEEDLIDQFSIALVLERVPGELVLWKTGFTVAIHESDEPPQ